MKKVLIIGASILQLPAIKKAKEMGYYVGVADYNPQAVGIKYSDEYFNVSTVDIEGITRVAKLFKPNGIMTLATDMPMRAVAVASQACGLPSISYETAIMATDKAEMIRAFEKHGVDHPWFYVAENEHIFNEIVNKVSFPCIMKPTDNSGSRGVVLAKDIEDLKRAYAYSHKESRKGAVIIEEYLQGPEFSVEIIALDGVAHVLQITDKLTTGAPHFVEMGHSQPTRENETNRKKIKDLAIRACKAVGIDFGPAHVEMILTESGPKMVELGARMGGDCITTHLVPLSTGFDMVGSVIKQACGESVNLGHLLDKGSAIRYFKTNPGVIKSISGIEQAKKIDGVIDVSFVHQVGEKVAQIGSSGDRIGFVIAQAETAEKAVQICEEAVDLVKIAVE